MSEAAAGGRRRGAAELDEALRGFGESVEAHYAAGQRGAMKSMLFNLTARTIVGSYCYLEHLPWFVRRLREACSPEEIGRRARRLARFPTIMSVNSLPLGYLGGRAQRALVDPGAGPPDPEDDLDVLDFWAGLGAGYIGTEEKLASDGGPMRIVDPEVVEELLSEANHPEAVDAAGVRRLLATLELYTFILNGESRVGVHNHGPYEAGEERLLVKEYVGLGGSPLLWGEPLEVDADALVRVMRTTPLQVGIGPFGNLAHTSDPVEEHLVREVVMVRRPGGELQRPEGDFLEHLSAQIADLQMSLYRRVAEWDEDRRAGYGAHLYASIAEPFAELAGLDLSEEMAARFAATTARRAPALISGEEPPALLEALGTTPGGNPYAPVGSTVS